MPIPNTTVNASRRGPRGATDDPMSACARALAGRADALVETAGEKGGQRGARASGAGNATAPAPSSMRRGLADAAALRRAHHDEALHRRRAPREAYARRLFEALERERIEALGANRWAGVRFNLDALHERDADAARDASADPLSRAAGSLLRTVREGLATDDAGRAGRMSGPSGALGDIETRAAALVTGALPRLRDGLPDQGAFADVALELIGRLALASDPDGAGGEEGEGPADEASGAADDDAAPDPEAVDEGGDEAAAEESDEAGGEADGAADEERDEEERALAGEHEEESAAPPGEARDEPPLAGVDPRLSARSLAVGYRVFTRAFDESVDARSLADADTLAARRAELDRHLERQGRVVRRLTTRLQRVLLARQRREWQYDLDEGQLDTRRLSRLVTDPGFPLVFKGERESVFRDTTVTLLIDNSRSMIGRPIMIAAACADILARTLERCGVGVEVLGFTTVELHGGRSQAAWEAAGRPPSPGRLNELRHIVYKSADVPYRSARRSLALMLERDILKQNIDGEALEWAASRLLRRPAERRILLVISDGAPVDTATLANNPRDYLDRHLDAVVADLERRGTIELAAIGIGHDVARFYSQAMSVFDARSLAPALLSRLESLFRRVP